MATMLLSSIEIAKNTSKDSIQRLRVKIIPSTVAIAKESVADQKVVPETTICEHAINSVTTNSCLPLATLLKIVAVNIHSAREPRMLGMAIQFPRRPRK